MGRLYTTREASAILRLHYKTIVRWARSGKLVGRKIGRDWKFSARAIAKHLPLA